MGEDFLFVAGVLTIWAIIDICFRYFSVLTIRSSNMPNKSGRPYRPEMTNELSKYPESQKGGSVPVKNIGTSQEDWDCSSVIEAGSMSLKEKKAKQEASVRVVRNAYHNRVKNGHVGSHEDDMIQDGEY